MAKTKVKASLAAMVFAGVIAALLMLCAPSNAWAAQESEPNDSFKTANNFSLGETVYGSGIVKDDYYDYFVIYIPVSGSYKFTYANDDYYSEEGNWPCFEFFFYNQYYEKGELYSVRTQEVRPKTDNVYLQHGINYIKISSYCNENHQYHFSLKPLVNQTTITKVTAGKKSATVKFQKKIGTTNYEVRYSLKSNMKSAKTKVLSASKSSIKITKLKKNKKYYFQVRVVKTMAGKNYYSSWSPKRYVKITR